MWTGLGDAMRRAIGLCLVLLILTGCVLTPNADSTAAPASPQDSLLALDLVEVDTDKALEWALEDLAYAAREALRDARIGYRDLGVAGKYVEVAIKDSAQMDAARRALETTMAVVSRTSETSAHYSLSYTDEDAADIRQGAIRTAAVVIGRRLRELCGNDEDKALLQLPDQPSRFLIQSPDVEQHCQDYRQMAAPPRVALRRLVAIYPHGTPPPETLTPGSELLKGEQTSTEAEKAYRFEVRKRVLLGAESLINADVVIAGDGTPEVHVKLLRYAQHRLRRFPTGRIAIVYGGEVIGTPAFEAPFSGNTLVFRGPFSLGEAQRIRDIFVSSGPLVPIKAIRQWKVERGFNVETLSGETR
jgi:preprotein translocase subunit SecD